tara:strand:- start:32 stop:454 length:423 start_codon:yes stop_codon:yes gene_type:complete
LSRATIIPKKHIKSIWPEIEEYAKRCARYTYGRFTAKDMLDDLLLKDQQLWVSFNAETKVIMGFLITEVMEYPQTKMLTLHFTGGKDFNSWVPDGLPKIQKFARDNGCSKIESRGRPGWEKMWKEYGYTKRFVHYELPVE